MQLRSAYILGIIYFNDSFFIFVILTMWTYKEKTQRRNVPSEFMELAAKTKKSHIKNMIYYSMTRFSIKY